MKLLGITKYDLAKRKDLLEDKLFEVLCPDGVTIEEKQCFEDDTTQFLSFLYDDFLIKAVVVPGTEAPELFKDSVHLKGIRKYINRITNTLTTKMGLFD